MRRHNTGRIAAMIGGVASMYVVLLGLKTSISRTSYINESNHAGSSMPLNDQPFRILLSSVDELEQETAPVERTTTIPLDDKIPTLPFDWCEVLSSSTSNVNDKDDVHVNSSVPSTPEDGLSYDYLLQNETDAFGSLKDRVCVCGCEEDKQGNRNKLLTKVVCSFDKEQRVAKVCVFQNALLYSSVHSKVPFVLAVCNTTDEFAGIFQSSSQSSFWGGHVAFNEGYDHIGASRIGNFPADCRGGSCRVPSSFRWSRDELESSANGWVPASNDASKWVDLSTISHSPELGEDASVAYLNAGDCNVNSQVDSSGNTTSLKINPWHCKGVWATWQLWSLLSQRYPQELLGRDEFTSKDAKIFEFFGGNQFYENRPHVAGWYEALSVGGAGYEPKFQYGSKDFVENRNKRTVFPVVVNGRLPVAVTNSNPLHSPIWDWLGPKTDRPSQVYADYRHEMVKVVTRGLDRSALHPILELQKKYPNNMRLVFPTNKAACKEPLSFLKRDVQSWKSPSVKWTPRIIPKVALVMRRSPFDSVPIDASCRRCLTNIDEVAQTLANELGFTVVMLHPTTNVPQLHQIYLFLTAQLIVAMHGGAWGSALVTTVGQAAVEILPRTRTLTVNAEHIIGAGGAVYGSSMCLNCQDTKSLSGQADVGDVVQKAKTALCRASKPRESGSENNPSSITNRRVDDNSYM